MRRMILAAVLLLSGCGGGGSEPAPVPPPQVVVPPPQPQRTATVFIGDSITAGWALPPDIVNAGVSGQVSAQMHQRFSADVLARKPAIVAILAGTNDVRHVPGPSTYSISLMADLAAASGACVIIGTVPPIDVWDDVGIDPAEGARMVAAFNDELKNLARGYGYKLADYYSVMVLPDRSQNPDLFRDRLHPSPAGYGEMWKVVSPLIDACGGA